MMVNIWEKDYRYDIIALMSSSHYNLLGFKDPDYKDLIEVESITMGDVEFIPGETYTRFGSDEKSSAGFIFYQGVPIEFCGIFENHLLFKHPGEKLKPTEGYQAIYFTWFKMTSSVLMTITGIGGSRLLELHK